jgi:uncharacterized protein (TIGR01777 family)
MKVLVAGGAGFIGSYLVPELARAGYTVTVLGRSAPSSWRLPPGVIFEQADLSIRGTWQGLMVDADSVINLTGASIFRRWTPQGKKLILESRLRPTTNLADAIHRTGRPGIRLISVSGVGYYGHRGDELLGEDASAGSDFLARVAVEWEGAAVEARKAGSRVTVCRLGHVLGRSGGVVPKLDLITRLGLGARWGSGRQWLAWVGAYDVAGALRYLLEHPQIEGPLNIVSPCPVRNAELFATLRRLRKTPALIPFVPGWKLRFLAGEFAEVFLNGQRADPARLIAAGYVFRQPDIGSVLAEALRLS